MVELKGGFHEVHIQRKTECMKNFLVEELWHRELNHAEHRTVTETLERTMPVLKLD